MQTLLAFYMLIIKCIFTLGTLSCSPCLRWTVGAAAAAAAAGGGGGTSLRHSQSAGDKKMPDSSPHRGRRTLLSSFLQSFLSSCLFIPLSLPLLQARARMQIHVRVARAHHHSGIFHLLSCPEDAQSQRRMLEEKKPSTPSPSITPGSFCVAGINLHVMQI